MPNELLSLNCTLPLQLLADPFTHKSLVSSKDISGKLSVVSFKIATRYFTLPSVWPLLSPAVKDADEHTVIVYNQLTRSKSWCEDRIELIDRRKVIPNPEPEKRLVWLLQLKWYWLSRSCWCAQAGHQMSLSVEHMACCLFGAMCSHVDCLSPPILLRNHCFSGSSCVSLVTLVCLPI